MNILRPLIGAGSLGLLAAGAAGLIVHDGPDEPTSGEPGTVTIAGFAFGPDPTHVRAGAVITWRNTDNADHTVNSDAGGPLDSGSLHTDDDYQVTFDQPGTYSYFCAFHPFMRGTIEVTR
jgi:plastocyanin